MNKNAKYMALFLIVLLISMLFPGIIVYAAPTDEAYQLGYTNGWVDGIEAGETDYANGDKKNYVKAMPNTSEIIEMYNLEGESSSYRSNFVSGYKTGFKEGYNMAYDNPSGRIEIPTNYPEELGYAMGEINGFLDFYNGKENKWTKSVPTTEEVIELFDLMEEPNDYKNTFISSFKSKYKEGYEEGYRKAKYEPNINSIKIGTENGEKLGVLLGSNNGKYDYYSGYGSDWERDLPSDSQIKSIFSLDKDNTDYENAFISSFKLNYKNSYEEAYRTANVEYNAALFEKGYNHGKNIGLSKGKRLAIIDVLKGTSNNESRYILTDKKIVSEYKLFYEDDKYEKGFIAGYKEGFKTGYTETYQDYRYNNLMEMSTTEIVPISGKQIFSADNKFSINIEEGSFYNDVLVTIDRIYGNININLPSSDRYIKASNFYNIEIINTSYTVNKDRPIKLNFESYDNEKAGIYRYDYNEWLYMPTKIQKNFIYTFINPEAINNKSVVFGVFIDKNAIDPYDLRGHWAKDEVTTYLRRGIVGLYEDNTFRPDSPLLKGQATEYINRVFNTDLAIEGNINDFVTYKEIEKLMKKVIDDQFSWSLIAEKMMWYKDKRSMSYSSMDNYITRAEMIYMLYCLKE